MILLADMRPERSARIIAVFGVGLVGAAVVESLRKVAPFEREFMPLTWSDPELQVDQLDDISRRIRSLLEQHQIAGGSPGGVVRFLWCAGEAGFHTAKEEVAKEFRSFEKVVAAARGLLDMRRMAETGFWLMSSAGGLFEGQRAVGANTSPSPRRPYGELKLAQERTLREGTGLPVEKIYRLTSVYGYIQRGRRRGLVPTLILNGMLRQVTHISGRLDTLRDYLWIGDLARFLSHDLLSPAERGTREVAVLASAKPTTIYEIQHMIETLFGRRIYLSFASDAANDEHITFSSDSVPSGLCSSDLRSNVWRIYRDALSSSEISR